MSKYEENIKYDKSYSVNKDEMFFLKIIQSIMEEKYHNLGHDHDLLMLFK